MTAIPVITTERLRLRAPRVEDFEPYAAFYASDRSVYQSGPLDRIRAWRDFASCAGLWAIRGYGAWAIEDRETGDYLGEVGLYHPINYAEPELGWMVVPRAEGRGVAFEASLAARNWAWQARGLGPLISYIDHGNDRSIRLAERLGAVLDRTAPLPQGEDPCLAFRHPDFAAVRRQA
ncbi:GNAT family N-acetyltransferase [Limibaculum sp. M0105]|uniref:GNAT family N-acetyltransferase n=1 Tax=Thermohalobaculum xanthum TaxID=2753746 RepID=A0A8J7SHF2_9RHOB|nr:GNAT family N-acetyltransferase [Thermohalobaculum xanthum]MBK0400722.1 GNAT family N-acetyltransferase [Thermohalobaculum xanthum]